MINFDVLNEAINTRSKYAKVWDFRSEKKVPAYCEVVVLTKNRKYYIRLDAIGLHGHWFYSENRQGKNKNSRGHFHKTNASVRRSLMHISKNAISIKISK